MNSLMQQAYYLKKLKEDFAKRTRSNPAYSLRAYAKHLGIHPSTLSQVLLGNRHLPSKSASVVAERLRLPAKERNIFLKSLEFKNSTLDRIKVRGEDHRHLIDEAAYQVIAEWEHYAVLTLFDCEKFEPSIESIQERLNIKKTRAEVVVDNLLKYGLLNADQSGKLKKAHSSVKTSEDTYSQALRESHRETLDLGKQKIDEIAIELRDFSSLMVAVDKEKIPAAKEAIREFRRKMLSLFEDGEKTDVFQLAIQLYPVSNLKTQECP